MLLVPDGQPKNRSPRSLFAQRTLLPATVILIFSLIAFGPTAPLLGVPDPAIPPKKLEPAQADAAVAAGLKWLVASQAPQGSWRAGDKENARETPLAILAYLGAGENHRDGTYAKRVNSALKYLILTQGRKGNFVGVNQPLATLALTESYGKTSDPVLKVPAQRAVNMIVESQNADGGWGDKVGGPSRLGTLFWNLQALKSAQRAGLTVPVKPLQAATKFLDSVASPDGGSFGDVKPANNGTGGLATTQGLAGRQLLGWGPRHPSIATGFNVLRKTPPAAADPEFAFFTIQFLHNLDGEEAKDLKNKLVASLAAVQEVGAQRPGAKGSWPGNTEEARLTNTLFAIMSLETSSRQSPLFR